MGPAVRDLRRLLLENGIRRGGTNSGQRDLVDFRGFDTLVSHRTEPLQALRSTRCRRLRMDSGKTMPLVGQVNKGAHSLLLGHLSQVILAAWH